MQFHAGHLSDNDQTSVRHGWDKQANHAGVVADTRCIPYLASPAGMTLLRVLRVRTEVTITLCLGALWRGAAHTRERLLTAIHGGAAILPGWEELTAEHQAGGADVLTPSQGALIFDEDFLRLAHGRGLPFAELEWRDGDDAL